MYRLNLDREKLIQTIEQLKEKYEIAIAEKPNGLFIYKFKATGIPQASLNVYNLKDGTTTLHFKTGANQELSLEIANHIKETCHLKEFNSNSFYLKAIRDEDFNLVIEFLCEKNKVESDSETKNHRIVKIKGHQGDTIILHKHSNGSFQAQGKPRLLFNDVIFLLSELMPFKEVIDSQLKYYETNLTSADIIGELEIRLPVSWEHIEDKIKSILSPSIAITKIGIELDDFSLFAFPALRALEGVMKQLFKSNKILITNKDGFGEYIFNRGQQTILTPKAIAQIKCINTQKAICDIYSFYSAKRHSLFHVDGTIVNTKILTYQEARHIIDNAINLIENSFTSIVN
ncbi:MAG: type II toxin-antitoxin system RnlA family toxin [Ferruginibacter sp.]